MNINGLNFHEPIGAPSSKPISVNKEIALALETSEGEQRTLISHSVLDRPTSLPPFPSNPELRAQLFAHIHDLPVQGTRLEGYVFSEICAYLNEVLSKLGFHSVELFCLREFSEESRSLKGETLIKVVARDWTKKVLDLKVGETLSFPAIWHGPQFSGHAMILSLEKRANFNFNITLYQTASSDVQTYVIVNGKKYQQPTIFAKDVTLEELFFDEKSTLRTAFFEQLLYFQNPPDPEELGKFSLQTFLRLFHNFYHKLEAYEEAQPLILVQRGGFCALKVFLARLRDIMVQTPFDYKTFMDGLKFNTLIRYFQDSESLLSGTIPLCSQARGLLKKATQDYCLHLSKMVESLSNELYQERYGTALDLLQRLTKIEERLRQQKLAQFRYFPAPRRSILTSFSLPRLNIPPIPPLNKRRDLDDPLLISPRDLKGFEAALKSFSKLKATAPRDDIRPLIFIDHLLMDLPLDEAFWKQVVASEAREVFSQVNELFNDYVENFLALGKPQPAQINTLIHFYLLLHQLALRIEAVNGPGCRLRDYALSFPFAILHSSHVATCLDRHIFERRNTLLNYAQARFVDTPRALFYPPGWVFKENTIEQHPDIGFALALLSHHSKLNSYFVTDLWQSVWMKELSWSLEIKKAFCLTFEDEREWGMSALKNNGFYHLVVLKKVASFLYHFVDPSQAPEKTPFWVEIQKDYKTITLKPAFHLNKVALKDEQPLPLSESSFGQQRYTPALKTEGEVLLHSPSQWLKEIRSGVAPTLQPFLLLKVFSHEIEKLGDPIYQSLFEHLFFKDIFDSKHRAYPLVEELNSQPSLSLACGDFVSKGLQEFYLLQPNRRPNVPACLFFIRFAQRVQEVSTHVNPDAPRHLETLLKWLDEVRDLTPAEKKAIHLHGLGHHLIQKGKDIRLLGHWLHFQHLQWDNALLGYLPYQYDILSRFYAFQPQLKELLNQPEAETAVRTLLGDFIPPPSLENMQGLLTSTSTYCLRNAKGSFWEIHLPTGMIFSEEGPITHSTYKNLAAFKSYQRIFPESKPILGTLKGDTFYFRQEPLGSMRAFLNTEGEYEFQRDEEGIWWHFVPAQSLATTLPYALLADHTHWVHPSSNDLAIRSKGDGKLVASLSKGTLIYYAPEKAEVFCPSSSFQEATRHFERPEYMLSYKTVDQTFLSLPRLKSLLGETLQFRLEKDFFVWQQDPAYILEENQKAVDLGVPNYITLRHREASRYKILVPCHPIVTQVPFSDDHRLDEGKSEGAIKVNKESSPYEELYHPQAGMHTYLVFDVADSLPTSTQTEGILFLVYLALAKRRYLHARRLLQKLPIHMSLSPLSKKMVDRIIRSAESLQDASPNAILLRALVWHWERRCLNSSHQNYVEDQKLLAEHQSVLRTFLKTYFLGRNHLEVGLFMTPEEERLLADPSDPLYTSCHDTAYHRSCSLTIPQYQTPPLVDLEWVVTSHYTLSSSTEPLPSPLCCTEENFKERFFYLLNEALKATVPVKKHLAWWLANFSERYAHNVTMQSLFYTLRVALQAPEVIGDLPDWNDLALRKQFFCRLLWHQPVKAAAKKPLTRSYLPHHRLPFQHLPQIKKKERLQLRMALFDHYSTHSLAQDYFEGINPKISTYPDITLTPPKLSDEELLCEKAIQAELQQFSDELKAGEAHFHTKKTLRLKIELHQLERELLTLKKGAQGNFIALERQILAFFAYTPAADTIAHKAGNLLRTANIIPRLDPEEIPFLFLYANYDLFRKFNPNFKDQEIEEVYYCIGAALIVKYRAQKLQRALILCDKLKRAEPSDREELLPELFDMLNTDINFDVNRYPEYLVAATQGNVHFSDLLIQCLNAARERSPSGYLSGIFQLPPGYGKTSQVETMLAYLATTFKGRLALLMVPQALLDTIVVNFERSQQERFGQKIVVLQIPPQKFTHEVLEGIHNSIQTAKSEGHLAITTPEFVHFLGMELKLCLSQESSLFQRRRFEFIQSILKSFMETTDVIPDELEQIYTVFKESNIPTSPERPIDLPYLDLVHTIYEALIKETVLPGIQKSVREYAKLLVNQQPQILLQDYKAHLLPYLAKDIFERHNEFLIKAEFKEDFLNYVQGRTNIGKPFLDELERLFSSSDPKEKLAANLMAVAKYLLSTVIPKVSLRQKGNHDYGRSRIRIGTVVHYGGADNPLETLFAWAEAMANSCQLALNEGIRENQIQAWGHYLIKDAEYFAKKEHIPLDATLEAQTFYRLTGIALREYREPAKIQAATKFVNLRPESILEVEREMMSYTLGYFEKRFNSNPSTLVQFSDTVRGFSATASLMPYPAKLSKFHAFDKGLSGQVAWELLRQEQTKETFIHFVQRCDDVQHILEKHPLPHKIRGIIDPIGMLKRPTREVAQDILKYFAKHAYIQAVLFFNDNTLMMWKKGALEPLYVGGTDWEAHIEPLGVPLENLFYFYDCNHCSSIHLRQPPHTVFLLTADESMTTTLFFQAAGRLGKNFYRKELEIVLHEGAKGAFESLNLMGLFKRMSINQGQKKGQAVHRHYLQEILETPKTPVLTRILDLEYAEAKKLFERERSRFEIMASTEPFRQFGAVEEPIRLSYHLKSFAALIQVKGVDELIEQAEKHASSPNFVVSSPQSALSSNMQLEMMLHQEVQTQTQHELAIDLKNELAAYRTFNCNEVRGEDTLEISRLLMNDGVRKVSLKEHLQLPAPFTYPVPYGDLFDSNLFVTQNFAYTTSLLLPVFHPTQKPMEQLLILLKGDTLEAYALSLHEATFCKTYLHARSYPGWLILSDGTLLEFNPHFKLPHQGPLGHQLERLLLQANLFNGEIAYLDQHLDTFKEVYDTEPKMALAKHWLILKVQNQRSALDRFYKSDLFYTIDPKCYAQRPLSRERRLSLEQKELAFDKLLPENYRTLPRRLIPKVPLDKVPYLQGREQLEFLRPQQIKGVSPAQVPDLSSKQIQYLELPAQIQALTEAQLWFIEKGQMPLLSDLQVSKILNPLLIDLIPFYRWPLFTLAQWDLVSQERLTQLDDPLAIKAVPGHLVDCLSSEQINRLAPHQIKYLTRPDFIRDLAEPDLIRAVVKVDELSNEQLRIATDEQLMALTSRDSITSLPQDRLHVLDDHQLEMLDSYQIRSITDPTLINRLPISAMDLLTRWQINQLNRIRVRGLLPIHLFRFLDNPELIQAVEEAYVNHFMPEQCPHLTDSQIRALNVGALIRALGQDKLGLLSPEKLIKLSPEQIQGIDNARLLHRLPYDCWLHLSAGQLKWASVEQLQALTDEDLIKQVPLDRLPNLRPEQLIHLSPIQVQGIAHENKDFLHQLPLALLSYILPEQLTGYTDLELMQLPGPAWAYIPNGRLIAFIQNHYLEIRRSEWGAKFEFLTPAQLNAIPHEFSNDLPPSLLQKLSTPHQIQALHLRNIYRIEPSAKHHLSPSQKAKVALHLLAHIIATAVSLIFVTLAFILGIYHNRHKSPLSAQIWSHVTLPSRTLFPIVKWHLGYAAPAA